MLTVWGSERLEVMGGRSVVQMGRDAGLLSLNPSDLVFESNDLGIAYYDYVLSTAARDSSSVLYLAKFDSHTNLETFESAIVSSELLTKNSIACTDISLCTLALLLWKQRLSGRRVLCLVQNTDTDCLTAMDALHKTAKKLQCSHHVLTRGERGEGTEKNNEKGMRLRLMLCQTTHDVELLSKRTLREARSVLSPNNKLFRCLCFPVS